MGFALKGRRAKFLALIKAPFEARAMTCNDFFSVIAIISTVSCVPFLQYTTYAGNGGRLSDQIPLRKFFARASADNNAGASLDSIVFLLMSLGTDAFAKPSSTSF